MNRSEIVNDVIEQINNGNFADAVQIILKGHKTKPCVVALLSCMVTESLIRNNQIQSLRFFTNKLEFFITNNIQG